MTAVDEVPAPVRTSLEGPFAWRGEQLERGTRWQRRLSATDLVELDLALQHIAGCGRDLPDLRREDFPLDRLATRLADISRELEEGCGVVRLRGLPIDRYAEPQLRLLFAGLCLHLGTLVYQNPIGQLIRPIRDEGMEVGARYGQVRSESGVFLSSRARTASSAGLRFHTDRADVVALLCAGRAKSGGTSKIASSVAVHNELLRQRPDLCELLYREYHRSRLGEEVGGEHTTYALPIFGIR